MWTWIIFSAVVLFVVLATMGRIMTQERERKAQQALIRMGQEMQK